MCQEKKYGWFSIYDKLSSDPHCSQYCLHRRKSSCQLNYGVWPRALRSHHRCAINSLFHAFHTEAWRGKLLGKLKVVCLNFCMDIHSKNNILSSCDDYYSLLEFSPFPGWNGSNLKISSLVNLYISLRISEDILTLKCWGQSQRLEDSFF